MKCQDIVKIVRLNIHYEWTLLYVEHFVTHDDFGHINTPSQNEPHNFEHWTQIPKRSTEIVLVTLSTCVSHFVSTTVISQFILISLYSSCNAFKCCSKRKDTRTMSGERKYIEKTLAKKAKTLQDLDSGMSMRACTVKYFVSVGTIINWKKNKSEIISSIFEFTSLFQKRLAWVDDNGKVIDERIYEWFANARCRNIPVSGPILQTKVLQVVANIGLNDFKALNGWLEAFCKCHCIQFHLLFRESAGMDENVVNHWKQNLPNIIQGYHTRDIWNVNEIRLF